MIPIKKYKTYLIGGALLIATLSSCTDVLEEKPRSILTPEFFETEQGVKGGLTGVYSSLRYFYGTEGAMTVSVPGTDEFTYGADGSAHVYDNYGQPLNPGDGHLMTIWNRAFTYINVCNGIIDKAHISMSKEMVAEAKFLRGHHYLLLLTTYGGVPLDLGSGELRFNTNPTTNSKRNTREEVLAVVINDLKQASEELPKISPRATGCVTQATALHYLAKAYLWNKEYDKAKITADLLIDNQSAYGVSLLSDFADVNKPGNEDNAEVLFVAEHTTDLIFSETGSGATGGPESGLKENRSCFFFTPYYENYALDKSYTSGGAKKPVTRSLLYQRPWRRFSPTAWLFNECFKERKNDSRYEKSFRTVWYCNIVNGVDGQLRHMNGVSSASDVNKETGDTAFCMFGYELSAVDKGKLNYRVWNPSEYTRDMFPHMKKFDDPNRETNNDASNRPFLIAKLSETYLIAAEAAVMSNADPTRYINVIRRRAAYRSTNSPAQNEAAATAMEVSKSVIDIDFILNERSRELCGEQLRWYDLVRTNKLIERVQKYGGSEDGKRNVKAYHMLRPIPQTQIDLMTDPVEKAEYQNPGY